ncbi:3-carboxy-cis,cis-muconate cycloisomerase [Nocardia sp. CA2R105]|uniref:3-carboxy-cis,cis-muconate cycloisomerase n=1 Tax=Nocardia coffeae TaxID=2873381 RepID=UPI001CA71A9C|nr:3-carboxy-cis,cis-muconate cycloisomerase [Nocardia coffeae]MBY8861042.1 3-carboxy-cis,cis-muconate cycloisomerase [Nocardia coffeae]
MGEHRGTRGDLFDPLFGAARSAGEVSDRAFVAALLEVEAALAVAAAECGVIPADQAPVIAATARSLGDDVDLAALGTAAIAGGNPVIPLVRLLRDRCAAAGIPASSVHTGATSQDITDTALMLLAGRAGRIVVADARAAADAAAGLARTHRDTLMVARTLGQQALPSTFGLLATTWFTTLDAAADRLETVLTGLPVQSGGAAGTLAALYPRGTAVADTLADELGLARHPIPWHTDRTPIAELACALGVLAGAVSKPATDVVAMSAIELGEVTEGTPGGSSAMPHKQNPVAAITARAAARRVPGLVSTVLSSMDHEFMRAAGGWHTEWETITDLLRLTGGAAHRLADSLRGLRVHPEALRHNLDRTGGLLLAERVTLALAEHTDDARAIVTAAATSGKPLADDETIANYLSPEQLRELLDPANYLGHAGELVDRALSGRNIAPTGHSPSTRNTGGPR